MKYAFLLLFIFASLFAKDAPTKDLEGSKDVSFLKRYEGSVIIGYNHKKFDKFNLPLSTLKKTQNKGNYNNYIFEPEKVKELKGEHTSIIYLAPPNRSPLEVIENYKDEVKNMGGEILYECEDNRCGANTRRAAYGGGGNMSFIMYFISHDDVLEYAKRSSAGYYALFWGISHLNYFNAYLPKENSYISVITYSSRSNKFSLKGRTIAIVDVVTIKDRENKMVLIKADEMEKSIKEKGQISLYGIYFDTDKAVIKQESKPTLDEIAKLLKNNKQLHILIVGHTDNEGDFNYNLKLSQRRAKAVLNALVNDYGIDKNRLKSFGVSYAAPVATNDTKEGRAKNRRVVLVKDK